jgi:hypothetical protein
LALVAARRARKTAGSAIGIRPDHALTKDMISDKIPTPRNYIDRVKAQSSKDHAKGMVE